MYFLINKFIFFKNWFESKTFKFHFYLGLIATFAVTISEVMKWKQRIYFVYNNATRDYWQGINPYDILWAVTRAPDEFLYGPLFNFFFLPFSLTPEWLGPFLWNIFSFCVFFYSVYNLPLPYSERAKKKIWLYLLPLLLNNLMYYQFNVLVAAIFLMAFSEMEKRGFFKAALFISFSALTKVYGGFQFLLFLLYEKPFKWGLKYVLPILILLFFVPMIHDGPKGLFEVYNHWLEGLSHHADTRTWQSIFYIKLLFSHPPQNTGLYQMVSGVLVVVLVLLGIRKRKDLGVRAGLLAILMGWMILFSSAPEISTYIIAISGYLLWYRIGKRSQFERILFVLNFILLIIVPQDIICPKTVMRFLIYDLNLNLIVFLITWLSMLLSTFRLICFSKVQKFF